MKILITSDMHKRVDKLELILKKHKSFDFHLDAGDSQMNLKFLEAKGIVSVKGNTDFFINLPLTRLLLIDNKKFLVVHGHVQHVKSGVKTLIDFCHNYEVDYCIFGHTHQQIVFSNKKVTFINPGALKDGKYVVYEKGKITTWEILK